MLASLPDAPVAALVPAREVAHQSLQGTEPELECRRETLFGLREGVRTGERGRE